MNTHQNQLLVLFKAMGEKPIAFMGCYVDITGSVTAGLLLSQLVYWSDAMNDKEFYKTDADLMKETRLGPTEFRNAKKRLQELDLVQTEVKGVPARTFYKVDNLRIIERICLQTGGNSKIVRNEQTDCTKRTNCDARNVQTITENKTENNRECKTRACEDTQAVFQRSEKEIADSIGKTHNRYSDKLVEHPVEGTEKEEKLPAKYQSNTRSQNFMLHGEDNPLNSTYELSYDEMIPVLWFNEATRRNIITERVNDVFRKFKTLYKGKEFNKIDWLDKWKKWCDNEKVYKFETVNSSSHLKQEDSIIQEDENIKKIRNILSSPYDHLLKLCKIIEEDQYILILAPEGFSNYELRTLNGALSIAYAERTLKKQITIKKEI